MKNSVARTEGERHNVTPEEKMRWLELWAEIRKRVVSNEEAYKALENLGITPRDPRTIKAHIENLLPLVKMSGLAELVEIVDYCDSRLPVQEVLHLIRERVPIEELAPKLANLADKMIDGIPSPGLVLRAFGSILGGGFPFDTLSSGH